MGWLKSKFWSLIIFAVLIAGALLGIDNSDLVSINLLGWQSPMLPIFMWLLLALILGIVIGAFLASLRLPSRGSSSSSSSGEA